MAESPSQQPQTPATLSDSDESAYWCYWCDTIVRVETLADQSEIVCHVCKSCFIELISSASESDAGTSNQFFDPSQFVQVPSLFALAAGEEYAPPPSPPSDLVDPSDGDYLRIEFQFHGSLDSSDVEDEEDGDTDEEEEEEEEDGDKNEQEEQNLEIQSDDGSAENEGTDLEEEEEEEEEENEGWTSDNVLHVRFPGWTGVSIESVQFSINGNEEYAGNPEDYVDTEDVLQTLAENLGGGPKGAPPAAKSAVSALKTFEIELEKDVISCAICKDLVTVGEVAKELACGHGYHGECIVPWLGLRNTCPVCRFELPTDDLDYEESRNNNSSDSSTSGNNFLV